MHSRMQREAVQRKSAFSDAPKCFFWLLLFAPKKSNLTAGRNPLSKMATAGGGSLSRLDSRFRGNDDVAVVSE